MCKATGGGRWEPKQEPALVGYRPPVPGAKAAYELEIEEQEREERARKANPIVRDGGQFLVYSPVYRPISNRIFSNSLPISFPP